MADLLLAAGADLEAENSDALTPEMDAFVKKYYHMGFHLKYYKSRRLGMCDNLFELSEDANAGASAIQAYVDQIHGIGTFSDYTDPRLTHMSAAINWTERFDAFDRHLQMAKETGVEWEAVVFPFIRAVFNNLGHFGQTYLDSYAEVEERFSALERGHVDEEAVQARI